MKKHPKIMLAIAFFFIESVNAEFYEYKDDHGCLYYTDNLNNITENQRLDLKPLHEIPLERSAYQQIQPEMNDSQVPEPVKSYKDMQSMAESLDKEQDELNQTYEALKAEKLELGNPPPVSAKLAEKVTYQTRVDTLNRKIEDYEERRKQLKAKVIDFNAGAIDSFSLP